MGAVARVGDLEDEGGVGGRFGEFDLGESGLGVLGLPSIESAEAEPVLLAEMGHGEAAGAPLGDEGLLLGDGELVWSCEDEWYSMPGRGVHRGLLTYHLCLDAKLNALSWHRS